MSRRLTDKQRKAIYLLLNKNYSKAEAAEELGVSVSTVYAWMSRNEVFAKTYMEEEDLLRVSRVKEYKEKAEKAVTKLVELLNCGNERVELSAAKELIEIVENKINMFENTGNEFKVNIVVEGGEKGDIN